MRPLSLFLLVPWVGREVSLCSLGPGKGVAALVFGVAGMPPDPLEADIVPLNEIDMSR